MILDFLTFGRRTGRIAQLGEHSPYKAGVTGSIPVPPTIKITCEFFVNSKTLDT
jgi:hypothetical protein